MDKKYEKIVFSVGSTIDENVKELLSYKDKGVLVSGVFNGITLYSDTVTVDGAYKEITGKTKAENDEEEQKWKENYERLKKEYQENPALIKVLIEKGREILIESRWVSWEQIVPIILTDYLYQGNELDCCLDIIKILNNNGTLDQAKERIESQNYVDNSYRLVYCLVETLCLRGSEFADYVKLDVFDFSVNA